MSAAHDARSVVLLGSTGSIGTQTLDVIARNPDRFTVVGLGAQGTRIAELARQAVQYQVSQVAIADTTQAAALRSTLDEQGGTGIVVKAGPHAAAELAASGADIVLNAMNGSIGLEPTLAALRAGSKLALANKESLVAGAALVKDAVQYPGQIVPVDSEHSAMAQALRSGQSSEVRRLILTASGGPFRGRSRAELHQVTVAQALAHPTWTMGPVVTINSATLMNKALELIEAHVLFDVAPDDITVVVHPQSIVHSAVEFHDGSTIAQVSVPDMRLPIAYALGLPDRIADAISPYDWGQPKAWDFEPVDDEAFPALVMARQALNASPWHPAILNAANEVAVERFRAGVIGFLDITDTVAGVLERADDFLAHRGPVPTTIADIIAVEDWARQQAGEYSGGSSTITGFDSPPVAGRH